MTKEELEKKIEELEEEVDKIYNKSFERPDGWEWYCKHPKLKQLEDLQRDYKLIQDYELKDIDKSCGDLMTLQDFIEGCEIGPLFTDYDGFGEYATKNKVSNITVYPSDIISRKFRKDFTHIMWYNK